MTGRGAFAMLLARADARPAGAHESWAKSAWRLVRRGWMCVAAQQAALVKARTVKRMRVVENVSLGDRRFVALVRVDEREFLIGTSAAGVAMLSELKPAAHAARKDAA